MVLSHVQHIFFALLHEAPRTLVQRGFYFVTTLGHSSVVVFFVLSGFFISGSVVKSVAGAKWRWDTYGIQRLARLYVPLIPALLLCTFWDRLGMALYGSSGVYQGLPADQLVLGGSILHRWGISVALGNLVFLQSVRFKPFGSDYPLWSLSYEFWYYAAFPCVVLALDRARRTSARLWPLLAVGMMAVWLGKAIPSYFVIWLMGLAVMLPPRRPMAYPVRRMAMAAALLLLFGTLFVTRGRADLVADFAVGVAFTVLLYLLLPRDGDIRAQPAQAFKGRQIVRGFADFSYTLYLVHMPLLVFLHARLSMSTHRKWEPDALHMLYGAGLTLLVVVYAWLVAQLTERHTGKVRAFFTACLPRMRSGDANATQG